MSELHSENTAEDAGLLSTHGENLLRVDCGEVDSAVPEIDLCLRSADGKGAVESSAVVCPRGFESYVIPLLVEWELGNH